MCLKTMTVKKKKKNKPTLNFWMTVITEVFPNNSASLGMIAKAMNKGEMV